MCFRGNFHNVIYVQTIRAFFLSPNVDVYTFAAAAFAAVAAHFTVLVHHVPNRIPCGSFSFIIVY